jgi:AcrR family transcriptional regulator
MARPIEKREHIERGVVEVVARKGLRGTTIQDIADAAKVSPGLLYRYWKNRDDLAAEVYREHYESLLARLANLADQEDDPWSRLSVMIRGFLQFADERPTILKFLLLSQHDLHGSVPAEKGIRPFLVSILKSGLSRDQFRTMDPELAAQILLGIVLQPVVGALYGHVSPPLVRHHAEIMDALERVFLDGKSRSASES